MKTAVLILVMATGGSGGGPSTDLRRPSAARDAGVQTWSDVADRIKRALEREPALVDDPIEVIASGLLVTLRGLVDDEQERRAAVEIARHAAEPQMMVENGLSIRRTDRTTVAPSRTARQRLEDDLERRLAGVAPLGVRVVQMPRLRVILEGVVPSDLVRRRVLDVVRGAPGVDEIEDKIAVRPGPSR